MPFLSELVAGRRERIPQPMSDIFRVYTCKILCIEQPNLISLLYLLSYLILCSEFPVISSLSHTRLSACVPRLFQKEYIFLYEDCTG